MAQIGAQPVRFRALGGPWRGMAPSSRTLPYHFALIENGYVSADGNEIRAFPGWKCVADPVSDPRSTGAQSEGYYADVIDSKRDAISITASPFRVDFDRSGFTETHYTYAPPTHFHGFEQVAGRWIVFGETDVRRDPIYYNNGVDPEAKGSWVDQFDYTINSAVQITVTLTGARNSVNHDPTGHNHVAVGDWVRLEGITGAAASELEGNVFEVTQVNGIGTRAGGGATGATIVISPPGTLSVSTGSGSGTNIWRGNSGPDGATGLAGQDRESLTIWTLPDQFDPNASTVVEEAFAAYVFNRQRDYGDLVSYGNQEGRSKPWHVSDTNNTWQSRRTQREIPYRLVPEVAKDRLLLAAPGYGCVFQAPVTVPIDYGRGDPDLGISWWANDIYDKPRCLGLPKPSVLTGTDADAHIWGTATNTITNWPPGGPGIGAGLTGATNIDLAWGGSSYNTPPNDREGVYKFRFTYYDPATGEESLPSEEIVVDTSYSGTDTVVCPVFHIVYPGYLMSESGAIAINCYRTEKDGSVFYFDRSIPIAVTKFGAAAYPGGHVYGDHYFSSKYGLAPTGDWPVSGSPSIVNRGYHYLCRYEAIYRSDDDLKAFAGLAGLPTLTQMPMGCKAIRTIRGWTMFGGGLGDEGRLLGYLTGQTFIGPNLSVNSKSQYGPTVLPTGLSDPISLRHGYGVAGHAIPPAYSGQRIRLEQGFDWPNDSGLIDKLVNYSNSAVEQDYIVATANSDRAAKLVYEVSRATNQGNSALPSAPGEDGQLFTPSGKLQISEQARPGVTPATNTTIVSDESDIEGIGSFGGQAVVATRNASYVLGWSSSPVGVSPEVASDEFGCIGANTMVEFDGGCAWMSDRGPVAVVGGAFRWIGQPLESYFYGRNSRYKYDRRGMMRHAWSCHDAERSLIYFGVFRDRGTTDPAYTQVTVDYRGTSYAWAAAPDEARSRFPCDEVLVYSYRSDAWSVWNPPDGMEVQWMTVGEDGNGDSRVFFMTQDGRIFCLDDTFAEFNIEPPKLAVSADATATSTVSYTGVTLAGTKAARGGTNVYAQAGMTVMFETFDPSSSQPNQFAKIVSFTGSTITLDRNVTVAKDTFIYVGVKEMTLHTNFVNPRFSTQESTASKVAIRFSQFSSPQSSTVGQTNFVRAEMRASQRVQRVESQADWKTVSFTNNEDDNGYTGLGFNDVAENAPQERGFVRGLISGQNHQVRLHCVGGSQLRLSDLYVEFK